MIPEHVQNITHSHSILAMEEAVIVNAIRGARNVGPYQKKVLKEQRLAHESFIRQEANLCIEWVAKHGGVLL